MKTFTTHFLLFLALCFTQGATGQWIQSTLPSNYAVNDILFYGNMAYVATNGNGIFQTQNFTNWTPSNSGITTSVIYEVISAVEGAYITLYAATDAGLFRSTMLGFSWSPVNNGLSNLNVYTVESDGVNLFIGNGDGTFRSDNYGQSWSEITIGAPTQTTLCFFHNGSDVLAGLINPGDYLYRSTDQGVTWNPYGTGLYETQQIAKLGSELFAVSGTVMYHSTDDGLTWDLVGPGLPPGYYITDIATNDEYIYIATQGGGYVQHTDSTNFRMITAQLPLGGNNLTAVAVNENWIVFSTQSDGLWYRPLQVTQTPEKIPTINSVSCNPNPASKIVNVAFSLSEYTDLQIRLFNLAGEEIYQSKNLSFSSGDHTISLDLNELPAGVYFCTVQSKQNSLTKKLIIQ